MNNIIKENQFTVKRGVYSYQNGKWLRVPTYGEYRDMDMMASGDFSSIEVLKK